LKLSFSKICHTVSHSKKL